KSSSQSQSSADVHQDKLCPPNKRYALMDANKKVDLENPLYPDKSGILADILKNHLLRFNIEGFHYSLMSPTTIPYSRFTKLIVSHYMTAYLKISRRVCDRYHNLADDVMIKSIFNSGKSKGIIEMKIPDWMKTDEIKLTENYRLYTEVFGIDIPMIQSQPIESTQGTHRTTNDPRSPNPAI
nr:hypothetical protein [Tanacetum cinerariifolium]